MAEPDLTELAVILQDTLGRIDNTIIVTAPPAADLGSIGAVAIDLQNNLIYGPKTTSGWGVGRPTVGGPGPAIELRSSATHVQWRVVGASTWINLIALVDLKGADGQQVELRTNATHIQWRLGTGVWTDLIALAALMGADGREIELQKSATHIQWRYVGDAGWTDLIPLADLKVTGDAGSNGWTQVEAIAADGERRVKRIVDWVGGTGTKPATGKYVGPAGLVDTAAEATDVRGPGGSGSGDMQGANNLSDLTDDVEARTNLDVYSKGQVDTAIAGCATDGELALLQGDVDDLTAAVGAISLPVKATGAELRTGTNDAKFLTAKSVTDAAAIAALTLATPDLSIPNQTITLSANSTFGAPTGAVEGKSGTILIKQDATGSRTLAYNAAWKPFGSVPALSTAANTVDLLTWFAESSAKVRFTLQKGGAA